MSFGRDSLSTLENEWTSARSGLTDDLYRLDRQDAELMRESGVLRAQILNNDQRAIRRERAALLAQRWSVGRQPQGPVVVDDGFADYERPSLYRRQQPPPPPPIYYYPDEPAVAVPTRPLRSTGRSSASSSSSSSIIGPVLTTVPPISNNNETDDDTYLTAAREDADLRATISARRAEASKQAAAKARQSEKTLASAADAVKAAAIAEAAAEQEAARLEESAAIAAQLSADAAEAEALARAAEAERIAVLARQRASSLRFRVRAPLRRPTYLVPTSTQYVRPAFDDDWQTESTTTVADIDRELRRPIAYDCGDDPVDFYETGIYE